VGGNGSAYVAGTFWVTNAMGNTTLDLALVKNAPRKASSASDREVIPSSAASAPD
jgi:hypothetical protein